MKFKSDASSLFNSHITLFSCISWIVRLFVGGVFVVSGLAKGIDVWGSIYKFNEYVGALGFEPWSAVNTAGVFLLSLLEFVIGVFLTLGCFRRSAPFAAALLMVFFLPLTLWLAIAEPIADCGCFGDAIVLSNWGTFWKNVGLSVGIVWLIFFNRKLPCLITPYLQWIAAVVAGAYFIVIAFLGYYYQPLIDFRPYKVGTPLIEADDSSDSGEDDNIVFVYRKNGVNHEFTIDDELPDEEDGWEFVERIEKEGGHNIRVLPVKVQIPEKNLRFYTEDGREDVTEEVMENQKLLILMIPDLSKVSAAKTWQINSLFEWSKAHGVEMVATMGGNPWDIRDWKDISLAEYPIYTSDDTAIEEVARGNPAVVYVENDTLVWKRTLASIDSEDFEGENIDRNPMEYSIDNTKLFYNISIPFALAMLLLVVLSLLQGFGKRLFRR